MLMITILTACGGSSSSPSSGFSVSPATASVPAGSTQQFSTSGGSGGTVTWSVNGVNGGNSSTGTITSGGLYTAPSVPPTTQPLTITANDGSSSATAQVTVTYSDKSLNGPFIFDFSELQSGNTTNVVGLITADGNGNITGTEDVNGPNGLFSAVAVTGQYSLSSNGMGTITINGGSAGTLSLNLALIQGAAEGYLTDASSGAQGGGNLYPQAGQVSNASALNGNYGFDFEASGLASNDNGIGILNFSSSSITGTNFDENNSGTYTLYNTVLGSYTVGSGNRGSLTLTLGNSTYHYVFYAISAQQLELICTDSGCNSTAELNAQTTQAVTSGKYVMLSIGNGTGQTPDGWMATGTVTPTSATTGSMSNLTQFENFNGSNLSLTNAATYTLQANGRGMTTITTPNGARNFAFNVVAASYWNLLETSTGFGNISGFTVMAQSTASLVAGQYVFITVNQVPSSSSTGSIQGILQINASGQVTGQLSINSNGTITASQVTGSITPQAIAGIYDMTLNLGGGQTANYVLALAGPGGLLVLRTDATVVGAGDLLIQYQTQ